MADDIIQKLKNANLMGRSGCCFPTWQKWQAIKSAISNKKYVICNASEGEPEVKKDYYILKHYPVDVINGIKVALDFLPADSAYLYINEEYYQEFKNTLLDIIASSPIQLFRKPHGYLNGEETVILEVIEGRRPEPRIKPPFPTEKGLFSKPTLINNVETFYCVSKIAKNEYQNTCFYSISGEALHQGVFELSENLTIKQVLEKTDNFPNFNFFVQAGGGAVGEILLPNELDKQISGIGSIVIFNRQKTKPLDLMLRLGEFFMRENCDKCTPCREGIYRIVELLRQAKESPANPINKPLLEELLFDLKKTSLCPFGRVATVPFQTAIEKLF